MTRDQLFIIRLRKKLGETQEQFGQRFGVTPNAVANWERGRNNPEKNKMIIAKYILDTLA